MTDSIAVCEAEDARTYLDDILGDPPPADIHARARIRSRGGGGTGGRTGGASPGAGQVASRRMAVVERELRAMFASVGVDLEVVIEDAAAASPDSPAHDPAASPERSPGEPQASTPGARAPGASADRGDVELELEVSARPGASGDLDCSSDVDRDAAPQPGEVPQRSQNWAVSVGLSGGVGACGVAAAGAIVRIVNQDTGDHVDYVYGGLGAGLGAALPGVGLSAPTPFVTPGDVSFEDFDGTVVNLDGAEVLAGPVGYAWQQIAFVALDVDWVYVGGRTMGGAGLDVTSTMGAMFRASPIPPGKQHASALAASARVHTGARELIG